MFRHTITAAILAACALSAGAVPAKPGVLAYPQPDGSTVSITLHGDEYGHWYESADGYVLIAAADGSLQYATLEAGRLVSTGVQATEASLRPLEVQQMLASLSNDKIRTSALDVAMTRSRANRAPQRASTGLINNYPTTGSPKAMVLLVEFADVKFTTPDANAAFSDLVNKPGYDYGGATGSALDYFKDQSNGIFTPDFEVFGPIALDRNESYYGASTPTAYDTQAWKMVQDACNRLHEEQPDLDWSEFDNDGDGFVDNIFIFYAGYGQNEGAPDWTIWPHSSNLYSSFGIKVSFNGVTINNYACTNELQNTSGQTRTGIGTFCHEYSHVLGLPDYYPTNGSDAFTPGYFEIMDKGSYNNDGNTPPNHSAVSRYSVGWLNPRLITGSEDVTLNPLHSSNEALLVRTDKEEEYFIFENRQRSGWDTYLPGHGMLVWHVDFDRAIWINNQVNNNTSHQRIDLVEADGITTADTRNGDPFPGTSAIRRFTSETRPAFLAWTGYNPELPITDIHETDGVITFKVGDGGPVLATVKALEPTEVTPVSFTAAWERGQGVYQYEVDVCEAPGVVPFMTLQVRDNVSVEITGLNPATEYSYVVRAKSGDRISPDSNRVLVTTLPPTFAQLQTEVLEAQEVGENSFVARWSELPDAVDYKLTVVEKVPIDPDYQTVDFTRDASGSLLPEGWTSTSNTTGSLKGYVGQAAPALRLSNTGERISSPTLEEDVNSLSFWYRGNSTADDAYLLVEALIDGLWTPVLQIAPLSRTEGVTVIISGEENADAHMPQGAKAVRIGFGKETTGSVYIDDIVMGYGATYQSIAHASFNDASQGVATSATVDGVKPETTYYYTVRAIDTDGHSTAPSSEMKVTTLKTGAVTSLDAEGNPYTLRVLRGAVEVSAAAGSRVRIFDMSGRKEADAVVPASGMVTITLPAGLHAVSPFSCTILIEE